MSSTARVAYFGPPVAGYEQGGAHIAAEILTEHQGQLVALRRPEGLFGGPRNALYFPHGNLLFGEDLASGAQRLVREQTGLLVHRVRMLDVWSWVSEKQQHWNVVLVSLAGVRGRPRLPSEVSELVRFSLQRIPRDLAWWKPRDLRAVLAAFAWASWRSSQR